ncbi:MAG: FAD:protein FMN transferase [Kiritimatiellae bacterium]|nr:FAD:protein FMN transferase [Kiritimatiellia bacterium]
MKKRIVQFFAAAAAAGAAAFLLRPSDPVRTRDEWPTMGTVAGLTFRGDAPRRDAIRAVVQKRYKLLEGLLSAWNPDSELSRLSREGGTNWIARVSPETADCYRMALTLAERSGRAFNPWVGAKLRELGFSHGSPFSDFDLGAIAKGFAVDAAWRDVTGAFGTPDLLIDLGGNLRVAGGSWRTGVRNPFGAGYAATVTLTNGEAVATSGNYERFVEKNGVRYSHILDGRTGEPTAGIAGVTVIAPSAALADGLSTTLFVLGPEEGMRFLERWHPGVAAMWIPDAPDAPEILASPAMAGRLTDSAFPVREVPGCADAPEGRRVR